MASHGIIAAYEGSKDPAEVAAAVREEASWTSEAAMFGEMWRSRRQVTYQALAVIGQHHPDKKTAEAAPAALHKASSARLPTAPHQPLQPSAEADGLASASKAFCRSVRRLASVATAKCRRASENFRPASALSSASGSAGAPARDRTDGHVRAAGPRPRTGDQLANRPRAGSPAAR